MADNITPTEIVPPGSAATRTIDLVKTTIGPETFKNPFFWIVVGIGVTLGVQYFLNQNKPRRYER